MSNFKKIIGIVLAVVMALSCMTVAFAAAGDSYTVTVTSDAESIQAGESATVTVKVTTNYNVSAMSIPVFYDKTQVTVSAGTTTLANATIATENSADIAKFFESAGINNDGNTGVRALVYIAPYNTAITSYSNTTVMTFTVTANEGATGSVDLQCLAGTQKKAANPSGVLYVAKNSSGNAVVDSKAEVIETAELTDATATINFGAAAQPDLAIKAAYASSGIVIDTNKTLGGAYDGVVYGFTVDATLNAAFYTNRLEATEGGTLNVVKTPYVSRPASYGTGTTIQVKSGDTVVKTYVMVIFGDVTGNGIGPEDTAAIKKAAAGTDPITDPVKILAANVVESGRNASLKAQSLYQIKPDDTSTVKKHIAGTAYIDMAALAASHNTYNTYYQ